MRLAFRLSVLVMVLFALNTFTWAQSSTTSVRGTVTDKSGAAIATAKVTLSNPAQALVRTVNSGADGTYEFQQIPPGTYQISVEMTGFRRFEQKALQLLVNTPQTVNPVLDIGSTSETVEVTGAAPLVNTTDATLGNAFGERQVKELPLEGRNVPDLLSLQAGVAYTGNRTDIDKDTDTRSGAVNGAHSDQTNMTLDGVDVNDQVNGYAFTSVLPVTLDSVQEFRVTTTNSNADAGRSSGAQVSLVTKSGTNNFHGSLYEYMRNTITSANDYFVKSSEIASGQPNVAPKLIRNVFGTSLGGPLIKDRLFFFVNYEGYRQREENSVLRIVPSDTLRDGVIQYQCADPSDPGCAGGTIQGLTAAHTIAPGNAALNASQLAGIDPQGIGPDPVVLNYLNTFPQANDPSGGDGLNYDGFRFRGPIGINKDWYIARADFKITRNGNHSLFWRGALSNAFNNDVPYLPGTAPLHVKTDYSKGFVVGYSAILKPTLINNFRWGYTRQSIGDVGNNDTTPVIFFRGLNDFAAPSSDAITRSQSYQTPVNNFVDDVSWTRGKHNFGFGVNVRFIRNPRSNFLNSFSSGTTNASGLDTAGLANTSSPLDPANNGLPAVDEGFDNSYDYPLMTMMGIVSEVDATFNFDKTGHALPLGAPVNRRWGADEYELYAQDAWRAKPNLTLTFGLRYSLFSPPWETEGTEVAPTISTGDWFQQRADKMLTGGSSETDPLLTFGLAGAANGKKGYYDWDYHNFAPRVAFAYSPRPEGGLWKSIFGDSDKSVIRGGFGIVYDRIGAGLLSTFDQNGSFGLSTQITNDQIPSVATAPRVTDLNAVPQVDANGGEFFPATPTGGFPFTPAPSGSGLGIYWGLDDKIKTPYSYALDFSIARELPHNMSLEVSYVGHLSHRLLIQEDLAMPLNIVDPKSKVDYFSAARRLSEMAVGGATTGTVNAAAVGPTAAYWQNMIQPLHPGDSYSLSCAGGTTVDPVVAAYDLFSCNTYNETTALGQLDFLGSDFSGNGGIAGGTLTDPSTGTPYYYPTVGGTNSFFNSQFHSLYAWRSIANANYHALQATLRKRFSSGTQFDFNYTYSKSIDLASDAERIGAWGGEGGQIINSWDPNALRAVSDFDTTHQFNTNFVIELPVGKGRRFLRDSHGVVNGLIGGWQLSGLARWTSGFPETIADGFQWPTNWQLSGGATPIGKIVTKTTKNADGSVNLFPDPQGPTGLGAFRPDLPGEAGVRNNIRGDGYAGLDMSLAKTWIMPYNEGHSVQFRWEVFNVPNLTRFDVRSVTNGIDAGPSFGNYTGLLTSPRVMQFALRYDF
jgi:Carboxypeptidase regulatory-like domain